MKLFYLTALLLLESIVMASGELGWKVIDKNDEVPSELKEVVALDQIQKHDETKTPHM